MNSTKLRGAIYGISAASLWGAMFVISDRVMDVIPPLTLLTIRLLMGSAIFGTALWLSRRQTTARSLRGGELLRLVGVGVVGYGIGVGAQFLGTGLSNASNGSVITSASPAFILLFAWLLLREPLTTMRILAVIVASVGVLITLDFSQFDLSSATFIGNLLLAGAALAWGAYSVLVRHVSGRYGTTTITFYALIGGLLFCLPASAFELTQQQIGTIDGNIILGILFLGIVAMAGAGWLWNRSFALVEASVASLFFFAQPLVGVLLSVMLGQTLTAPLVVGGSLIVSGVLLSIRGERRAQPIPERVIQEQTSA